MNIQARLYLAPALFLLLSAPLWGESEIPERKGLFARILFGFASGSLEEKGFDDGYEHVLSADTAADFYNYHLGAALTPNWTVHGNFNLLNASAKVPGKLENYTNFITYGVTSLGVGFSYYFLPQNIYIAPGLRLFSRGEVNSYNTNGTYIQRRYAGRGLSLTVGKEWPLCGKLSLGLAFFYHRDSYEGSGGAVKFGTHTADLDELKTNASSEHFAILLGLSYN